MLQIQGKVNAITLDSCNRTGLVFQDLVSSCEVVNCTSVEVQSTGIMPTIAIDKTDGIAVSPVSDPRLHVVCHSWHLNSRHNTGTALTLVIVLLHTA